MKHMQKVKLIEACPNCGNEAGYVAGGMVHCANSACSTPLETLRIGLIEGRHPLPVHGYLLKANVTDEVGFHQGVYDEAKYAAEKAVRYCGKFSMYVTGLTVAAIGAFKGMQNAGITDIVIMNYDKGTDSYESVDCW